MSETGNLLLLNPPTVTSTVRSVGTKLKQRTRSSPSCCLYLSYVYGHVTIISIYRLDTECISCSKPDDNVKLLIGELTFEVIISGVKSYTSISRSRWPRSVRCDDTAAWVLGVRVRISSQHGCQILVSVVCVQVQVSATGWSLVQRSSTVVCVCVFCVMECDQVRH